MDIALQIPRNALIWTLVAVVAVMLPQVTRMPSWVIFIAAMCVAWRLLIYAGKLDFPGRLLRTGLVIFTLILTMTQIRNIGVGLDSAASLLALGFVFKLIEMRYKRDIYIVISLCFVMTLVIFLYSQSALTTLYVGLTVTIIISAMIALNRSGIVNDNRGTAMLAARMVLQAIPLTVVLFMVFPRIAPLWAVPLPSGGGMTGVSDEMSPGDLAMLGRSADLAFRAQFEGDSAPGHEDLYWRGLVLDNYDGFTWSRTRSNSAFDNAMDTADFRFRWEGRVETSGEPVNYNIILEPTRQPWVFGLHLAEPASRNLNQTRNFEMFNSGLITQRISYDVTSYMENQTDLILLSYARRRSLQLPEGGNEQSRQFAEQLRASVASDMDYANAVLAHFRTNEFFYSLNPPLLGDNRVDDFLFNTQEGFCEHYASTFAFLMRAAGIPTRVVVGYHGAEYNRFENYMMVYQYNAHAWNEIWIEGQGWVRMDPTGAVSPDRIRLGVEAALRNDPAFMDQSLFSAARLGGINWLNNLRLRLDAIEYEWNRRVVNYDEDVQIEIFEQFFGDVTERKVLIVLFVMAAIAIGGVGLTIINLRPTHHRTQADKLYFKVSKELARIGLARNKGEGPLSYRDRVVAQRPELKNEMDTFVGHYLALTYQSKSGGEGSRSELATLRSAALQLRRRLPPLRRFGIRAG